MILWQAWEYVLLNQDRVLKNLFIHIQLSTLALGVAIAIAIPVGILLTRYRKAAFYVINTAALGRTVPALAILALLLPFLGTGFLPALVALTLIAIPPILTNTYVGLTEVDPDSVEAARGMGMNTMQLIRKIELPLVVPVVFTGIRTSAVQVFASATLAAFIGGGGLGDFIMAGVAMNDNSLLLVGAIPVAIGALLTDWGFGQFERFLTPKGLQV
jgi:osmoprotectant transport system permease protein